MLRIARFIGITLRCLAVVALAACTDPAGPGPQPGFVGLTKFFNNPFVLGAAPPLPQDSCPPFVASTLPTTRRTIIGSGASIALPATAVSAAFDTDAGVAYRIPGEGLIGVAYDDNAVTRLDFSDGRSRNPIFGVSLLNACNVTVDGRAARLFVEFQPRLGSSDSASTTPVTFSLSMFVTTSTPAGRQVNITLDGATVTSVAFQPPANAAEERNFAVRRLLSHVASIKW